MDTPSQTPKAGGTVESTPSPVDHRAARAGDRYELYDPFAEVKHRTENYWAMIRTAERTGAIRFQAIDAAGHRIPIEKTADGWFRREPERVTEQQPNRHR